MAIEPLKIQPAPITTGKSNSDSVVKHSTLQDEILGINKKQDDKKADEKKDKDKVQLSPEAQDLLDKIVNSQSGNDGENKSPVNSIGVAALEFRGLAQRAKEHGLTDKETQKITNIKQAFTELGIDDEGILEIADATLEGIQGQTTDLVGQLLNEQITGSQLGKLNTINKLLNVSNGFGSEEVEGALQVKADQLSKRFNDAVEANKDQTLSRDDIKNLDNLQKQLSQILGYKLSVKDTIGPNGVII